jgi:ABC-type multidrug transport system fused ATPase/permease subunit
MADLIFVARACISEGSNHEALLQRDGLYAELYALQASADR